MIRPDEQTTARDRVLYGTGVALLALTIIGLLLFRVLNPAGKGESALLVDVGVIMGLALIKAYLVGAEFMELRKAVGWLKAAFAAWLVATWLGVLTATYLGMHVHTDIHFL